jgi:hypothetical protein
VTGGQLWDLDARVVLVGLFALFLLAAEVGFLAGRRHARRASDREPQIGPIQAALLGLLALLLGFSFAMAQSRYDARRALVLEEANAIGTAYLRAQLLPEPEASEIADALRRYVDVRLARLGERVDESSLREVVAESERLHAYLWERAVRASRKDARPVVSLSITALNQVIDVHSARLAAFRNHVPDAVFLLLYFVAAVAMGVTGYANGLESHRSFWPTVTMAVLIAVVIATVMDLDRPRRGFITVSQQSMLDLRESLKAVPPAAR